MHGAPYRMQSRVSRRAATVQALARRMASCWYLARCEEGRPMTWMMSGSAKKAKVKRLFV